MAISPVRARRRFQLLTKLAARTCGGDPRPNDGWGWVATIAVDPRFRLRGIGRTLLHACEKELGVPRVRLTVRSSNQGAITMYEKEGYKTIDIWQAYYNDGESAIVMEKAL